MNFIVEDKKISGNFSYGELSISPDDSIGYRPFELFVSSMMGCSGTLLRNILIKKRHTFDRIEAEVSSKRNAAFANRIEQLDIRAQVITKSPLSIEQEEKIAKLVIDNCGVIQSVKGSIEVSFKVISTSKDRKTD
ncbi:MAG: OsmC family protein [Bacillota bacterium]